MHTEKLDMPHAAPAIGTLFDYNGCSYRCTGWLRRADPPKRGSEWAAFLDGILFDAAFEREGARFQWCLREHATHVAGSGVAGCLAEIAQIRVTGRVEWPAHRVREEEARAVALGRTGRIVA